MREVDELTALDPNNSSLPNRKKSLMYNRPNYRLMFILSVAYFLLISAGVLASESLRQISWLLGLLCLPAAHYLNLSGRWVGLTKMTSNWMTVALALSTFTILIARGGLNIFLFIFLSLLVFPILKDNALRD